MLEGQMHCPSLRVIGMYQAIFFAIVDIHDQPVYLAREGKLYRLCAQWGQN